MGARPVSSLLDAAPAPKICTHGAGGFRHQRNREGRNTRRSRLGCIPRPGRPSLARIRTQKTAGREAVFATVEAFLRLGFIADSLKQALEAAQEISQPALKAVVHAHPDAGPPPFDACVGLWSAAPFPLSSNTLRAPLPTFSLGCMSGTNLVPGRSSNSRVTRSREDLINSPVFSGTRKACVCDTQNGFPPFACTAPKNTLSEQCVIVHTIDRGRSLTVRRPAERKLLKRPQSALMWLCVLEAPCRYVCCGGFYGLITARAAVLIFLCFFGVCGGVSFGLGSVRQQAIPHAPQRLPLPLRQP